MVSKSYEKKDVKNRILDVSFCYILSSKSNKVRRYYVITNNSCYVIVAVKNDFNLDNMHIFANSNDRGNDGRRELGSAYFDAYRDVQQLLAKERQAKGELTSEEKEMNKKVKRGCLLFFLFFIPFAIAAIIEEYIMATLIAIFYITVLVFMSAYSNMNIAIHNLTKKVNDLNNDNQCIKAYYQREIQNLEKKIREQVEKEHQENSIRMFKELHKYVHKPTEEDLNKSN